MTNPSQKNPKELDRLNQHLGNIKTKRSTNLSRSGRSGKDIEKILEGVIMIEIGHIVIEIENDEETRTISIKRVLAVEVRNNLLLLTNLRLK